MATKYLAKTFQYGVSLQADWATPNGQASAYKIIPYTAGSVIFDPDVKVDLHNTSGQNGIHKEFERVSIDGRSGLPKVSFSMNPVDLKSLAPHLIGALLPGKATGLEYSDTPYGKNFGTGGLTGTIDFNGDDAQLHTIAMNEKASIDDMIILENAIIGDLNLSWDFNAQGVARYLQMSGTWVGNEMNFELNPSGSWTSRTFTPMGQTDLYTLGTFSVDGANLSAQNVRRFTFNVANNVTTSASTTAGKPNNYDITPVYTSTVIMDYNATTEKILKDYQDGATVIITLDSSIAVNTEGDFTIGLSPGILQKQPFMYNGDFAGIELDILWYSSAAGDVATMILSDAVDWGYTDNGATP